jgi:ABC-2 type transport system permease protein
MRYKRLWAIFRARNREFFRDREAFGWNFLFPFLIILGFGVIFKGDYRSQFKVGVFPVSPTVSVERQMKTLPDAFVTFEALSLIGFETREGKEISRAFRSAISTGFFRVSWA